MTLRLPDFASRANEAPMRTRPTDEPPFSGTFLNLPPAMISGIRIAHSYCRRRYYFRTVTGPCSGCLRLFIVVEPTKQFQGFLNLWSRRLRRHIPRVFAEFGAHGREGFDPTLLANFRAQDRKAF
jgi:hypothetical protein